MLSSNKHKHTTQAQENTMNKQSFRKLKKDDQMKKQKSGRILDIKYH